MVHKPTSSASASSVHPNRGSQRPGFWAFRNVLRHRATFSEVRGTQLESRPMLLLGHRGSRSSGSARENTFPAFDLALEHGCGGFEFDVRLTGDEVAVVCRDAKVGRLSVGRTAASRLQELPTLEAVLERYLTGGFLDIELKMPGVELQLHRLLSRH